MERSVRILGVCGSLQQSSSNRRLLERASALSPEGAALTLFEGLGELPHFNPDLEAQGTLASVDAWRRALAESDALLVACPEYGHSLPGVLKNAIDWVIGTGELERKVIAVTAAVAGPGRGTRGLSALRQTLDAVSARIVGGAPISRGEAEERELAALLSQLVAEVEKPDQLPEATFAG